MRWLEYGFGASEIAKDETHQACTDTHRDPLCLPGLPSPRWPSPLEIFVQGA